jgi:predicted flavoprotein YhiN
MKTIAIIWAGAAGLMTAATILENTEHQEYHIHIFEKNKTPGNKVIISWGGRCNVTTSITDKHILASKYTRGWDFIRKAMGKFGPKKVYDWFESHGVPLKVQEDLRVFPVSDDGYDIVDLFERIFAKYRDRVTLHYGEGVSEVSPPLSAPVIARHEAIQVSEDSVIPGLTRDPANNNESLSAGSPHSRGWQGQKEQEKQYTITTPKWSYTADVVVVTTGGSAYSHTGSTGDGYAFARSLGHTITPLGPSLSSFLTREKWTHELSGLAFPEARVGDLTWPILLTHFGISGPLSFMYSSQIAWESLGSNSPKIIHLAPVADMDEKVWNTFLIEEFSLHPKKTITTVLSEKLPRRFVEGFVKEYFSHITDTYLSSVSKADRLSISELLGVWIPITLIERRPGDEFVTAGGVNTDELDPETMESRVSERLYFAGEVLNVDGYTGGFSLQICWASGYVAGRDIVDKI